MNNKDSKLKAFQDATQCELCQRLREIRGLLGTQEEAAIKLNHDQSLISRYENGRRIPPLNYIRQLARSAKLTYIEEQYLLGLAGVLIPTKMPSPEQIQKGIDIYCRDIQSDWYPSMIVDHNFGIWVMNEAIYEILGESLSKNLVAQYITVLDLLFGADLRYDAKKLVHEAITPEINQLRRQQLTLFKLINIQRRHEAFYRNYPQHLGYFGEGKPRIHSKSFLPLWYELDVLDTNDKYLFKDGGAEIAGLLPSRQDSDVRYRRRIEQAPHLPMFYIMRFEPLPRYEHLFARYKWVSEKMIKLWEIADIQPIIEGIDSLNLLPSMDA